MKKWAIVELYLGDTGKQGFYNSQEAGLAKAMSRVGYDCFIFLPCKDRNVSEEKIQDGVTIVRVPARVIGVNAVYDWSILAAYNIDIALINADNRIFTSKVIRYCEKHGILCCTYSGTFSSKRDGLIFRLFFGAVMKKNARAMKRHMAFIKTAALKEEAERYGISRTEVAPVGLDLSVIPSKKEELTLDRAEYGIPAGCRMLLLVGRIEKEKHPEEALDVIASLPGEYHLTVIGTGSMDSEFSELIKSRGLSDRISRIKKIPNRDIHRFYADAEYSLNMCPNEIFGMSILEAMYQGCNVIAVHAPGPDEIIEDGVNGFTVSSAKEMTEIIRSGRRVSADAVAERVTGHFIWDITAGKMDSWIRSEDGILHSF